MNPQRVQVDNARAALAGSDDRGAKERDVYVLGARDDAWGGVGKLECVTVAGCKLITIRGARMLERAAGRVEGLPGPVTICVEAEGDIARRRLIFFKIRGNQPLKRLLRAYVLSAFLHDQDTPLDFYFGDKTVYAHDTAQALGLQDADVIRATLPIINVTVQGVHSLTCVGTVELQVRASEQIVSIVTKYHKKAGHANVGMALSSSDSRFVPISQDMTPSQSGWVDGHVMYAWPVDGAGKVGPAGVSGPGGSRQAGQ